MDWTIAIFQVVIFITQLAIGYVQKQRSIQQTSTDKYQNDAIQSTYEIIIEHDIRLDKLERLEND